MNEIAIQRYRAWRRPLRAIITSPRFEWVIIALITVNAIILGLQTDKAIFAKYGPLLEALDATILSIFVVELLTRFYVFGWRMLKDPWSVFDIFVVGVALVPASGHLAVLRSLRILRALRLISTIPSMRRVVAGLLTAIPGMASIVMLLLLVLYVASVMATQIFGGVFPDSFGTLGASVFSLIQIMTMEGWADISGPVMEHFPYAWIFFLVYMLVTSFAVLNLFIGIIVDAMQSEALKPLQFEEEQMRDEHTSRILSELEALRAEIQALRDDGLREIKD